MSSLIRFRRPRSRIQQIRKAERYDQGCSTPSDRRRTIARALVEVVGDSASAVRALEQTSAAATASGDAAEAAAPKWDALAASMARAQATRVESLLGTSASLKQFSAANAGTVEGAAASELAAKKQAQAYKLLGIQAAQTKASLTQTAGQIGRGLTTYVTAPAAFIGYEAVKQAIDFNQQMLLLKTQAGDATDSIRQLSNQVLELAKTGSPQGPVLLAQGLFHLVSLGLRGSQAIGTLREAAIGAGMGLSNLEDVTTALGGAVVSGIKGAQNYKEALATLQATAAVGNMRFGDFAASVGNILPIGAAAGVSLKEIGAAMAVLTDRGMSAEMASTRLRMTLGLMQAPSAAATKALADMGVNASDLGKTLREPNGLLKVLEILHTAIDRVGPNRGYADLLAGFGRSKSGLGIETLVKSLDSPLSSYQAKLQLIGQQEQQFGKNQETYMASPAYKLHAALSQVQTDLVQLGQSLTPAVTGLAGFVSSLANGFSALPGPIKESIGVVVGLLALGGPLGLAISGVGKMFGAMSTAGRTALQILGWSMKKVGVDATIAGAEARAAFLSMLGPIAAAAAAIYGLDKAIKALTGFDALHKAWGSAGFFADNAAGDTRKGKNPYPMGTSDYALWQAGFEGKAPPHHDRAGLRAGEHNAAYLAGERAARRDHSTHHGGPASSPPTVPNAYTSPPTVSGTSAAKAAAAAKKKQTAFDQSVHADQMLAQARIDLANGEYAAAQALLKKDQARLQLMLSEAKTSEERYVVLKQLAEVEKMRHSKADQFQLSPELQAQIAKVDAEAVLNPLGLLNQQVALAKRARADAMHAINSHTLTMQGLIQAWQIVGQENQVIRSALGMAYSYHAVSTAALTQGLNLSHTADLTLRERLAQAEAHRGYAPASPTTGFGSQTHHHHHVHVELKGDAAKFFAAAEKRGRWGSQRAGGRR